MIDLKHNRNAGNGAYARERTSSIGPKLDSEYTSAPVLEIMDGFLYFISQPGIILIVNGYYPPDVLTPRNLCFNYYTFNSYTTNGH
jgi:hypothetical protein